MSSIPPRNNSPISRRVFRPSPTPSMPPPNSRPSKRTASKSKRPPPTPPPLSTASPKIPPSGPPLQNRPRPIRQGKTRYITPLAPFDRHSPPSTNNGKSPTTNTLRLRRNHQGQPPARTTSTNSSWTKNFRTSKPSSRTSTPPSLCKSRAFPPSPAPIGVTSSAAHVASASS